MYQHIGGLINDLIVLIIFIFLSLKASGIIKSKKSTVLDKLVIKIIIYIGTLALLILTIIDIAKL